MNTTQPAAYLFKNGCCDAAYHPMCMIKHLVTFRQLSPTALDVLKGVGHDVEEILDANAAAYGVDRSDESSFETDVFPKTLAADDVLDGETCTKCGLLLIDEEVRQDREAMSS